MTEEQKPSQEQQQIAETYYGVGSFLFEVVKVFILAIVIIVPIRVFLFQPFFVQGESMVPNFEQGEYLIVNEFGYKQTTVGFDTKDFFTVRPFKDLERGDVIVFRYPKNPSQFFIKRVIGLPGERIEIQNSSVMIYSEEYPEGLTLDEEAYIPEHYVTDGTLSTQLEGDEYFVIGDNRQHSHDSRSWGPLKRDRVIGKVLLRAWPLDAIAIFRD